jgi:hypothetical protein
MDSSPPKSRLREQARALMHSYHFSISTDEFYGYWIRYFIRFNQLRHPVELSATEVNPFPTWLAVERMMAATTQNLALNSVHDEAREGSHHLAVSLADHPTTGAQAAHVCGLEAARQFLSGPNQPALCTAA